MDYIILNNDGSLNKQSLKRYINQGSHGVDKIFIGWASGLATDIFQAVFTLANQTTNTVLGEFESDYNYDGEHTINGWVITLTEEQTTYKGLLMVSARIIRSGIVQVAYPFTLVINETGVTPDADSGLTIAQIDSYLLNLQTLITGAVQANTDSALSSTSENPVQNKVVKKAIDDAIAGVYKIQGSATVQTLEDLTKAEGLNGYVYNVTDSGTLTNYDESTLSVVEGDNVCFVWNEGDWFWDNMAGFIDPANLVTLDGEQTITGAKTFTQDIITQGKVVIGASGYDIKKSSSNLVIEADGNPIKARGDLLPNSSNTYNLGNSSSMWKDLYLSGTAYIGTQSSYTPKLYYDSNNRLCIYNNGDRLKVGTSDIQSNSNIIPLVHATYNLGSNDNKWNSLYLNDKIYAYESYITYLNSSSGGIYSKVNFAPNTHNGADLGTAQRMWKDLYLNGNLTDGTNSISVANIGKKLWKHTITSSGSDWANMSLVIIATNKNAASTPLMIDLLFSSGFVNAYLIDTNDLQSPVTNHYISGTGALIVSAVSISGNSVSAVSGTLVNLDNIVDVVEAL